MRMALHSVVRGFTLIELLIVVAVIGILAAIIISAITNAAQDSRAVIARQQQAVLQEALNAWVAEASSGGSSLQSARTTYASYTTSSAKLAMISNYLDVDTYSHFTNYTTNANLLQSSAMAAQKVGLQFSTWGLTDYPRVEMVSQ